MVATPSEGCQNLHSIIYYLKVPFTAFDNGNKHTKKLRTELNLTVWWKRGWSDNGRKGALTHPIQPCKMTDNGGAMFYCEDKYGVFGMRCAAEGEDREEEI